MTKGALIGVLLAVLPVTGAAETVPVAVAGETGSSCGGPWVYGDVRTGDGICTFDFVGFPITVEGSWAIDPEFLDGHPNPESVKTDLHMEVVVYTARSAAPITIPLAPGWQCEVEPRPYEVSCSASYTYGADFTLPAGAGPVVTLECLAHRHSPASLPGSGEFRCSSGEV